MPRLAVAAVGLVANPVSMRLLGGHAGESLNVKAAFLEVVSDLLGSIGVILAALITHTTLQTERGALAEEGTHV